MVEDKQLKETKNKLLLVEELDWRIKSRATWIAEGDSNTKYFHHFVAYRKQKNTIWDLTDAGGDKIHKFGYPAFNGVNHFESLFSKPRRNSLVATIRIIQKFPRFIT